MLMNIEDIFKEDNLTNRIESFANDRIGLRTQMEKSGDKITNFKIPVESNKLLYSYADVNNRILDCKINNIDDQLYVEFSIITEELENIDTFDLYFVSDDEGNYQKTEISLREM